MINPGANWVPITDPVELLAFLKELKLTPKTFTEPKPLLYDGIYTKKPVPCKVVGYLDKSFIVIVVKDEWYEDFTDEILKVNPKIEFSIKSKDSTENAE